MPTSITSSVTEPQKKQYFRFVEDATSKGAELALEQVVLDKDGLQLLLTRGGEFNAAIAAVIVAKTRELSLSNQFANEEVRSSYGYPDGYRVKPILEQVATLKGFFPNLATNDEVLEELASRPLPAGADGWFAIPRYDKVGSDYNDGFLKVLSALASKRKFYNYREGKLSEQYLRQSERAIAMWKKISEEEGQGGDILIVAAQFGFRHRGRSVRRAREVMVANEFCLGAFAVGCMLLTHPEREVRWEQLHIDCAGDEYAPDGDGQFVDAPIFRFIVGRLEFDTYRFGRAIGSYGSASGFAPQ